MQWHGAQPADSSGHLLCLTSWSTDIRRVETRFHSTQPGLSRSAIVRSTVPSRHASSTDGIERPSPSDAIQLRSATSSRLAGESAAAAALPRSDERPRDPQKDVIIAATWQKSSL